MNSRNLINLSSLSLGLAAAVAATVIEASPFSASFADSARVRFGPSLNKDYPSASPGPAGTPSTSPVQQTTGMSIPAAVSTTPVNPVNATNAPGAIGAVNPGNPSATGATGTAATVITTQPTTIIVQPDRPASGMERAGQMVRSVLRKIDPKAPVVAPADTIDLRRSPGSGPSVNTTASISVPPNSSLPVQPQSGSASTSANTPPTEKPTAQAAPSTALNTSMNKQEKKVALDASNAPPRQLQRGLMNEQKMNVGTHQ